MRMLLISNPGSRSGKSSNMRKFWVKSLADAGVAFTCVETSAIGHAFDIASSSKGYDVHIAAGGDGTINEVIDGTVQSGNPDTSIGVLYSGTSPDFCRFHGIPVKPAEAVKSLLSGKSRMIDVAMISYEDNEGKERLSHFACSCNIGIGASVAKFSNRMRRYMGDKIGTFTSLLKAFAKNPSYDMELSIDGAFSLMKGVTNISVLKNPHIASGLKLNLGNSPDDGRLFVMIVAGRDRLGLLRLIPGLYSGNMAISKDIFIKPCSNVSIRSKSRCEIEFDGDPRGFTPVSIEILPRKIKLIGGGYD